MYKCSIRFSRLDGAICDYNESYKLNYLEKLHKFGVVNIEMEGKLWDFEMAIEISVYNF